MTNNAIAGIDHAAIATHDLSGFIEFYQSVLGAKVEEEHEIDGLRSVVRLRVGSALLNVHRAGHSHPLVARAPMPGALDLCFRWNAPIGDAVAWLTSTGTAIIDGPSPRTSSDGFPGRSVYFRDPDGNLLELLSTVDA